VSDKMLDVDWFKSGKLTFSPKVLRRRRVGVSIARSDGGQAFGFAEFGVDTQSTSLTLNKDSSTAIGEATSSPLPPPYESLNLFSLSELSESIECVEEVELVAEEKELLLLVITVGLLAATATTTGLLFLLRVPGGDSEQKLAPA